MDLKLDIKSSDVLAKALADVKERLEADLQKTVRTLGKGAQAHAEQLAQQKMPGSLANLYQENLYMEEISDNMVVVGIREKALWLEEGRKGGFMDELLNGPKVKTSKDGHKYRVIPFKHSTSKLKQSSSGQEMVNELRGFLKKQGVPHSKTRALALDSNGSPRTGKIHSFNIKDMRGAKKKGVESLSKNLQGVSVFQNMNEKTGKVERNIMTFRVISEKHSGSGKWEHPGKAGEKILDETFKWVQDTWQKDILPELKKKYESK